MGMSASQVRLLQLTERKNDIGYELTMLSNDKVSLTRDMQRIAREYQESLNSQCLKWSNNGGVTYMNLSYANLMKPSEMNRETAYLLTDCNEKVVIDNEYQKYAEMISPNGKAGGDWESVRTKILSEITGIDANKIENMNSYQETVWKNKDTLDKLNSKKPKKPTRSSDISNFIQNTGTINGNNIADLYSSAGKINLGNSSTAGNNLQNLTTEIGKVLGQYVEIPELMEKACKNFSDEYQGFIGNTSIDLSKGDSPLQGDVNNYTINVQSMMDMIIGRYKDLGGDYTIDSQTGQTMIEWVDINSTSYQNWKSENEVWQKEYQAATAEYDSALNAKNQLFTASDEKLINFYDSLFSTIAEKGWTFNAQVNDDTYLNDMLQNNLYTITTVEREAEYNKNGDEYAWINDYETDIATNCTNIFKVNDSNAREEALIEYEYEKSIISAKEAKIDTRMQDLQTEQAAISQMIQSIEQTKNDNIDRTFNITG